jgi:hypothetical protein
MTLFLPRHRHYRHSHFRLDRPHSTMHLLQEIRYSRRRLRRRQN